MTVTIYHYFDYKSPYAYLAQEQTYQLVSEYGLNVEWLPYTLDIPSYLGDAKLDGDNRDTVGTRNAHQWRRVKYSYMDCRREANRRGLTIRGPKKIFDSSLAHIGFLFAKQNGEMSGYHDRVYSEFWRRELDIENLQSIEAVLGGFGFDLDHFADYRQLEGPRQLEEIRSQAEAAGVFGVPSYLVGTELFWGLERIPRLLEFVGIQ